MSKTKVVVFTKNGAKILVNPTTIPDNSLINPDLSQVKGISPSFWELKDGTVVAMSDSAKKRVMAASKHYVPKKKDRTLAVILIVLNLIACAVAYAVLKRP